MTERVSGNLVRSTAALGLVAVIGTALLSGVYDLTRDRIAAQERRVVLEQLEQIVSKSEYDNALQDDRFTFRDEAFFPRNPVVTAYRARRDGKPVAVILRFDAINGYSGPIRLLVGIRSDGSLAGVRVVAHSPAWATPSRLKRVPGSWASTASPWVTRMRSYGRCGVTAACSTSSPAPPLRPGRWSTPCGGPCNTSRGSGHSCSIRRPAAVPSRKRVIANELPTDFQ